MDREFLLARPRFELGSKAPKASMLGRYIRRNTFDPPPGLPGVSVRIFNFIMLCISIEERN